MLSAINHLQKTVCMIPAGLKDLKQSEIQKVGWRLPGKSEGKRELLFVVRSLSFARGRSSGGLVYNSVTPVSTTEH